MQFEYDLGGTRTITPTCKELGCLSKPFAAEKISVLGVVENKGLKRFGILVRPNQPPLVLWHRRDYVKQRDTGGFSQAAIEARIDELWPA